MDLLLALADYDVKAIREILASTGLNPDAAPYRKAGFYLRTAAASTKNATELMEALLDAGADPNISADSMAPTALSISIEKLNTSGVKLLLERGANAEVLVDKGNRPMHLAACLNVEIMQLLIDFGASLNTLNGLKFTPLDGLLSWYDGSQSSWKEENVRFLIAHGADVTAKATEKMAAKNAEYVMTCIQQYKMEGRAKHIPVYPTHSRLAL